MNRRNYHLVLASLLLAAPAAAQLSVPGVPLPTGPVGRVIDGVTGAMDPVLADAGRQLASLRATRFEKLVRANPQSLELTRDGYPARRGEILVFDPNPIALEGLKAAGFRVLGTETFDGLDVSTMRLAVPGSAKLRDLEVIIGRVAPGIEWTPDHLYEQSGRGGAAVAATTSAPINTRIGIIDGAPGAGLAVAASKGFAKGAPVASDHGSAVVSLLKRAGARNIAVADVYGNDPAGGSATAVARGLGWLVTGGAKVVTVSLVGPNNALLSRAIASASAKGVVVVAAVGNDGPAAPPAYPASYPSVVAVTGVDGRNRALIEAGRALHLDYAAPAADISGTDARGRAKKLRGTSFAAPLVAARIAAAGGSNWRSRVDGEARDLGKKGPDGTYGRGLVCEKCR
ncbi:S8 family serine peptidase [Tsuneonella sp. HG094]